MIAVSYHDSIAELQGLIGCARGAGPFARPEWFARLEHSEPDPLYVCARQGEAALVLPLAGRDGALHALRNWYAFSWAPLGRMEQPLLTAIAVDLARRAHRVVLEPLSADNAAPLLSAFNAAGWRCDQQICDANHYLLTRGRTFAAYLAERPGQLRSTLRRKTGALTVQITSECSDADWAAYAQIYDDSWKPAEGDAALLRDFAQSEAAHGRLRLGFALHTGQPVAAQMWTVDGGVAYIHKLAHLRSAQHLSPGTVLTAALIEYAFVNDKVGEIDFGTGDDPYKRLWMDECRPRYRLDCLEPRQPAAWPALARRYARRLSRRLAPGPARR